MPLAQFTALMREQQIELGRPFEPCTDGCRVSIDTTAETDILLEVLRRTLRR